MNVVLDKIVIKPIEEKNDSIIDIPDALKRRPSRALVIAVGPGKEGEPMDVKEGETIQYMPFGAIDTHINGEDYLIIKQSDALIRL